MLIVSTCFLSQWITNCLSLDQLFFFWAGEVGSQIALLQHAIAELTVAISTMNKRLSTEPLFLASPTQIQPVAVTNIEVALDHPPPRSNDLISDETVITDGESTAELPGSSANVTPSSVAPIPQTPTHPATHDSQRAARHTAVRSALARIMAPRIQIPASTSTDVFSAEPVDVPAAEPVVSHSVPNASQLSAPPSYDASPDIPLGRHWYLVTKGLQTGVFQSW
jgi:hypothetical protein